ncbi:MAG: NAD(P)H-dependent oxidoreductase [Rhodobacteraceae bacterium]|nr:MAG: NAD(P)H-dependent oxidoreductase [Paracoccaceae bacterium]
MRLLGISGSLREGSFNTQLVKAAAEALAPDAFTLADLRLPLYDGDLEAQGMPEGVTRLVDEIRAADAIVISTPEYNAGLSGVLKNALDWISRVPPMAFAGKPTAILSAAAGRAGGARAQMTLRHCLVAFRPVLLQGPEVMIPNAQGAFEGGALVDPMARKLLGEQMAALRALVG